MGKKYEILLMVLFLVFFLFLISEALLFISFFWATFHSLSSPSGGVWPGEGFYVPDPTELTFISLQVREFRIMGLNINDSVYSSCFFFLTGLHFFHLLLGLFLLSLFFWGQSFQYKKEYFWEVRMTEIHLFYNLQL